MQKVIPIQNWNALNAGQHNLFILMFAYINLITCWNDVLHLFPRGFTYKDEYSLTNSFNIKKTNIMINTKDQNLIFFFLNMVHFYSWTIWDMLVFSYKTGNTTFEIILHFVSFHHSQVPKCCWKKKKKKVPQC